MSGSMLRLAAEISPQAAWILIFFATVIGTFVLYVGIALVATLLARDEQQGQLRYRLFRDLIDLFRPGSRK